MHCQVDLPTGEGTLERGHEDAFADRGVGGPDVAVGHDGDQLDRDTEGPQPVGDDAALLERKPRAAGPKPERVHLGCHAQEIRSRIRGIGGRSQGEGGARRSASVDA